MYALFVALVTAYSAHMIFSGESLLWAVVAGLFILHLWKIRAPYINPDFEFLDD